MRIYMDEGKNILKQVVCNQCGKALKVKNGMIEMGVANKGDKKALQVKLSEVTRKTLEVRAYVKR